jgi:large subunit ribosomal protein L19
MGIQNILESINKTALKTDVPRMDIGDTVNVHCRIVEGNKERIQVFQGVVIARAGRGVDEMITVRRIVEEHGVERVFPVHSPKVSMYEVVRRGNARRSKLYFLRDRAGKSRRLSDRRRGLKHLVGIPTASTNPIVLAPVEKADKADKGGKAKK